MTFDKEILFPIDSRINQKGNLEIGGCDMVDLVGKFGTPLYLFDEHTIRSKCKEFVRDFTKVYPNTQIAYASKAYINPTLARIFNDEGLGLDVVSGGELAVAQAVNFPPEKIYFHGNNKSYQELEQAVDYGIGRVVVDNFYEITLLNNLEKQKGVKQPILIRISPSVDPHTHSHTTTGVLDSKFGFAIETGDAEKAVKECLSASNLSLMGLHFHLGSPIFEMEPYETALDVVLSFAAKFKKDGLEIKDISPGGGFAIGYHMDELPPIISDYAEIIANSIKKNCSFLGIEEPRLIIEPGRSIIGRAGVAIYSVGAIKEIKDIRKYVSLDGGMGDNIRPALYEARYDAVVINKMNERPTELVTLAGKFCESGDILVKDIFLPKLESGDLIAIPASGAYNYSMASNYNLAPRPPVIMLQKGHPKLIRERESYQDMMAQDIP